MHKQKYGVGTQYNVTQSLKSKEILTLATTWMDFEIIMVRKVSQTDTQGTDTESLCLQCPEHAHFLRQNVEENKARRRQG